VLLVPANIAPNKPAGEDPGPQHRLRMCRLALDGATGLSVCAAEIERGGLSYTVDTLESLHASHPNAGLTFVVGADAASTLGSWREPAKLLELAQLAVAARAGSARQRVLDALAAIWPADGGAREPGALAERVSFLEMPAVEVSSSIVRACAANGEPIEQLVGAAVAGYIAEHRLYRAGKEAIG